MASDRVRARSSASCDVDSRVACCTGHAVTLVHMRRLHLCASCFSCVPPCCKSRVTLARTDPLLTLPVVETAANWHMRTGYPRQVSWWYAEMIPLTSFAFTFSPSPSFPSPLLSLPPFYEILVLFGTQDTTWCLLQFTNWE